MKVKNKLGILVLCMLLLVGCGDSEDANITDGSDVTNTLQSEKEDDEVMGDDGIEQYMEIVSQMVGTYSDIEGYGIQVSIEQNEYGMADIVFMTEDREINYIFEDCCPDETLLLFQINQGNQEIFVSMDEDGYLAVDGCEMKTYNTLYTVNDDVVGDENYTENNGEKTPKEYIFSGSKENYPIYVFVKDTEYIVISRYIFMGDYTDLVDIKLKSSVGDDSGNKELVVRRPSFGEDEYSLTFHDYQYDNLNEPIVIEFAEDMSYIDVTATWQENVTNEQSLYNGHYELEGIYTFEEYAELYY